MQSIPRHTIIIKAIRQLGLPAVFRMGIHSLAYTTGYYKFKTRKPPELQQDQIDQVQIPGFLNIPPADFFTSDSRCIPLAEEICSGFFHPFSGEIEPLCFDVPEKNLHWTHIRDSNPNNDLKLLWEPARFSWVASLVRAYAFSNDARYIESFWQHWKEFQTINHPYLGPNWVSGQEVAIRLINWVIALQFFANDPASKLDDKYAIIQSIFQHANRIQHSIGYAKAQNNNHLLTETAGLYTAGCLFKHLPIGKRWMSIGWSAFMHGINTQIDNTGAYIQQSTNYHRLMLQTAMWMSAVARTQAQTFPEDVRNKLAKATVWLFQQMDPTSGHTSNLGHNDGSYLFPLTGMDYSDYRPVVQSAAKLYLEKSVFPPGPWDEMSAWFSSGTQNNINTPPDSPRKYICGGAPKLWTGIRMAQFFGRPAHADQLHAEIWWDGENIVRDPGTYRYTAPHPWDNRLARAAYHNAVTIDNQEPMLWAGRFLWLDWSKVNLEFESAGQIVASTDGYKRLKVNTIRSIRTKDSEPVEITDTLTAANQEKIPHTIRLHWLLPDWQWQQQGNSIMLKHPLQSKSVTIQFTTTPEEVRHIFEYQLVRAGKVISGKEEDTSTFGWYSPTYNMRVPALSIRLAIIASLPISITSLFTFNNHTRT